MKKKLFGIFSLLLLSGLWGIFLIGCGELTPRKVGGNVNIDQINSGVMILGTDFSATGVVGMMTLDPEEKRFSLHENLELCSPDAVIRAFPGSGNDRVFVLNRLGFDYIQILNPQNNFKPEKNISLPGGSNPQDILFLAPDRAYVTRNAAQFGDILIINPELGLLTGSIPLNQLATNKDGLARPAAMFMLGYKVFILLQNLDKFFNYGDDSAAPGLIAVIDIRSDTVIDADPSTPETDAIRLQTSNPQSMAYDPQLNRLLVASAGLFVKYHPELSGLEMVDPEALVSLGAVFTGDQDGINGNVTDLEFYSSNRVFLVISEQDFSGKVVEVDPVNLLSGEVIYWAGANAMIPDIALDPQGILIVAEHRRDNPRLLAFDMAHGNQRIKSVSFAPPPFSLALWEKTQ